MRMVLMAALIAAAALSACSKADPPLPPKAMPLDVPAHEVSNLLGGKIMPGEKGRPQEFLIQVKEPGETKTRFVALRKFVPLGPDTAVVLLRAQETNISLERANGHADAGMAMLVYLKWAGREWKVSANPTEVLTLGSSGEFGEADLLELHSGMKALLIHHGGVWQGNWTDFGALVPLDGGSPRTIASLPLGSGNGDCPADQDCFDAKSNVSLVRDGAAPDAMPEIHLKQTLREATSLFNEKGFSELTDEIKDYTRERYKTEPVPRRESQKDSLVVYKWDGKSFVKSSGEDIIPKI